MDDPVVPRKSNASLVVDNPLSPVYFLWSSKNVVVVAKNSSFGIYRKILVYSIIGSSRTLKKTIVYRKFFYSTTIISPLK